MRAIVSIFLLTLFTVPFFWAPTWLSMERRQIQKHVRNQILPSVEESELITFTVLQEDTATRFKWEHAKEFEFEGKMYDIVKRKQDGNTITYLVWQDDKETSINTQIKQLTNNIFNSSSNTSNSQLSFQLLIKSLHAGSSMQVDNSHLIRSIKPPFYNQKEIPPGSFRTIFNPPQA